MLYAPFLQQPDGAEATAPAVAHAAEVFVRRFRYFQQLPPAVVRRVLLAAEPLVLGADNKPLRLCEQGTVADAMFVMLQGTAWAHYTPSTDALNGRLSDSAVEPVVSYSSSAAAAAAAVSAVVKLKRLKRQRGRGGKAFTAGNHTDSPQKLPTPPLVASARDVGGGEYGLTSLVCSIGEAWGERAWSSHRKVGRRRKHLGRLSLIC